MFYSSPCDKLWSLFKTWIGLIDYLSVSDSFLILSSREANADPAPNIIFWTNLNTPICTDTLSQLHFSILFFLTLDMVCTEISYTNILCNFDRTSEPMQQHPGDVLWVTKHLALGWEAEAGNSPPPSYAQHLHAGGREAAETLWLHSPNVDEMMGGTTAVVSYINKVVV